MGDRANQFHLRAAEETELPALSELCFRAKAHWGYDAAFMQAARAELSVTRPDLDAGPLILAEKDCQIAGLTQIIPHEDSCELDRLYVDPAFMGQGCGAILFGWCVAAARDLGFSTLTVVADPHAQAFYEHLGAILVGDAPSGSIPGRRLPRLEYRIR